MQQLSVFMNFMSVPVSFPFGQVAGPGSDGWRSAQRPDYLLLRRLDSDWSRGNRPDYYGTFVRAMSSTSGRFHQTLPSSRRLTQPNPIANSTHRHNRGKPLSLAQRGGFGKYCSQWCRKVTRLAVVQESQTPCTGAGKPHYSKLCSEVSCVRW